MCAKPYSFFRATLCAFAHSLTIPTTVSTTSSMLGLLKVETNLSS